MLWQVSISTGGGDGKTGLDVWDGALLLTDHLLQAGSLEGQRVIELGAGTGVTPNLRGLALDRSTHSTRCL
jgi:hypothetical protein